MSLVIHDSPGGYSKRTIYNCTSATCTLAIAVDFTTAGEKLTKKAAGVTYFAVDWNHITKKRVREFVAFQKSLSGLYLKPNSLHIAGNGIYTFARHGVTQKSLDKKVYAFIKRAHEHFPITKVYSGGQTGLDEAGVKAALRLNIPVEVTLPKGYLMRDANGVDHEEGLFKSVQRLTTI